MKPKGTTTMDSFARETKGKQFYEPHVGALSTQDRKLLAEKALAVGVDTVMSNHYYEVGGGVYRQADRGAMGLELTSVTSKLYMLSWDQDVLGRLRDLGFRLGFIKDMWTT